MPKVLLTGGSGFIAAHVLEQLLERGYDVVTTVRSEDKAEGIRAAHSGAGAKLTVAVVPDIAQPGAFDDVFRQHGSGLEYVQHTASPFHYKWSDAKTELLDPAINGTEGLLKAVAAHAPGVRRVVVTSSFAAILSEARLTDPAKTFSEADWNPSTYEDGLRGPPPTSYRVSKTCAEKAAWDFVAKEKPGFDLATICPPMVFGPIAHNLRSLSNVNTSNERLVALMHGDWRDGIPATGVGLYADVRDVARAHVEAMERPAAGGQRFFTTGGFFSNRDIAAAVRQAFPDLADKLPGEGVAGGEFTPDACCKYDNKRATEVLGIDWISPGKSVVDAVRTLREVEA
ncbi:NAD(P)-binding protein [Xylariaceae sp. FL0804]|nr:NAD(P)-binding protein [Xylariaceae sp. FL0804]